MDVLELILLFDHQHSVFCFEKCSVWKQKRLLNSISHLCLSSIFCRSCSAGKEKGVIYKVSVSFLEVYNENIRDLLNDSEEFLDLREDPIKGEIR